MFASNTSPLRWPKRIVLGTVGIFLLVQVLIRVLRRAAPGPMPSRLAPLLTTPLRLRLFGSPKRVLDRARVTPSMRVLEVGPGPGVYTVPLALRVASSREDGKAKDKCSHTKLHRKEELEQKVGERLADTIEDSAWESLVNRTLDQKVRDLEDMRRGSPGETRERLCRQVETLQGKLTRVEELYFDEVIDRERFDSKKKEIDEGIAAIKSDLDEIQDIDETIQVAEDLRRFLLDNRYILFGSGPAIDWITTHALFAPHTFLTPEDQDQVDWITPEKRQDYYRRMKLKVEVYQEDEPKLEISGIRVCQNGSIRDSSSR